LLVASHHAAGNRRDCSIAAGGALRCGDIRKNEQGGCGKREIDHIGFHVAALTNLDCGMRVIRTQKLVYANSAQPSGGMNTDRPNRLPTLLAVMTI
jgi:hypothetical protein